jgi:hypothetical protein
LHRGVIPFCGCKVRAFLRKSQIFSIKNLHPT